MMNGPIRRSVMLLGCLENVGKRSVRSLPGWLASSHPRVAHACGILPSAVALSNSVNLEIAPPDRAAAGIFLAYHGMLLRPGHRLSL
jgi:hypothetical protein